MHATPSQQLQRSALLPCVEMRQVRQLATCYDTHTHDEFSVGVVDAGSATYRNGRRQAPIHQGMAVMFNPGDAHSCNPCPGQRWSYRMLFIDSGWIAALQAETPGLRAGDYAPFALAHSATPALYQRFGAAYAALETSDSPLEAEEKLLAFLLQHCFACRSPRQECGYPLGPLQRAKELILDQLGDTITLDALASTAGLSRYHLVRSFKQAYGQTPHAFQIDQRINHGKQLLKRGGSLAEVARALGFADQSHFQRHFKRRHAVTPKVYQQSLAA